MVAHEIGHCVGLQHVQSHCLVYRSVLEANLMQQQRNIGLREWELNGQCRCLASSPSCGECRCPMDADNFRRVGEARYLDEKQIDIVLSHVRTRDFLDFPPQFAGYTRVGSPFVSGTSDIGDNSRDLTVESGDVLVLLNWSKHLMEASWSLKVNHIQMKTRVLDYHHPEHIKLRLVGVIVGLEQNRIVNKGREITALVGTAKHLEFDVSEFELFAEESLGIQVVDGQPPLRIATHANMTIGKQRAAALGILPVYIIHKGIAKPELLDVPILVNYDVASTAMIAFD